MPLMKYVVFVGSALVLLLLSMNWLLPDPTAEPVYTSTVRPVIKISSIETLPEKVVLDNTMPYTAPPSDVMRVATRPLPSALTFEKITPGLLPEFSTLAQVAPKTITEKRDPAKKAVANGTPTGAYRSREELPRSCSQRGYQNGCQDNVF